MADSPAQEVRHQLGEMRDLVAEVAARALYPASDEALLHAQGTFADTLRRMGGRGVHAKLMDDAGDAVRALSPEDFRTFLLELLAEPQKRGERGRAVLNLKDAALHCRRHKQHVHNSVQLQKACSALIRAEAVTSALESTRLQAALVTGTALALTGASLVPLRRSGLLRAGPLT